MTDRDALWSVTEPEPVSPPFADDDADTGPNVDHTPVRGVARSRARRRFRRLSSVGIGVVGMLVAYFVVCFAQVWWTGRADHAHPADAIVVLGAAQYDGRPSPQLAARLDHTAELYARGVAPVVVVTGGKQPGDRYTEAAASALYLIAAGVPADAIVQEDRGRSTWQSLAGVAEILTARDGHSVVIVTDPYHSLRSRLIAAELGLQATTSPTRTSPVRGFTALRREFKEAAGIAVGRIIGFERLWKVTG